MFVDFFQYLFFFLIWSLNPFNIHLKIFLRLYYILISGDLSTFSQSFSDYSSLFYLFHINFWMSLSTVLNICWYFNLNSLISLYINLERKVIFYYIDATYLGTWYVFQYVLKLSSNRSCMWIHSFLALLSFMLLFLMGPFSPSLSLSSWGVSI